MLPEALQSLESFLAALIAYPYEDLPLLMAKNLIESRDMTHGRIAVWEISTLLQDLLEYHVTRRPR